jgi:hypothetical protein
LLHPTRVLGCTLHLLELASDEDCGHLRGDDGRTFPLHIRIHQFLCNLSCYAEYSMLHRDSWIVPLELPKQWKMCAGYGTLGALGVCVGQDHCKQ